jgi:DNA-binding beta-propeller fold protein YncE
MSHASRFRLFLLTAAAFVVLAVSAAAPLFAQGNAPNPAGGAPVPVPEAFNPYAPAPYRLVPNWPPPDPSVKWGGVIQAEPDVQGNLWIVHRGTPPILKLDPQSGKVLAKLGVGMFAGPHGFTLDTAGNLYVTDCPLGPGTDEAAVKAGKGYQLFKMTPDGKVLMTLGKAGVSKSGIDTFVCPTDVAVAANGDIFVTDGHDPTVNHYGDRVAKFSKDGKFIKDVAQMGSGPGQVWQPHSIAIDSQGRLFIADRSNNRVEILDQDGNFIDIWRQFSRPSGIYIDKKTDTIYVVDSESSPMNHPDWPRGIRIGSAKTGAVKYFISGTNPEGVTVDAQGNVYGCVVSRSVLEKYEKVSQ